MDEPAAFVSLLPGKSARLSNMPKTLGCLWFPLGIALLLLLGFKLGGPRYECTVEAVTSIPCPAAASERPTVCLMGQQHQDIEFRIEGTVTDTEGKAIPGAIVTITPRGRRNGYVMRTDGNGVFSRSGMLPYSYVMRVEAEGYEVVEQEVSPRPGVLQLRVSLQKIDVLDVTARRAQAIDVFRRGRQASLFGDHRAAIAAMQEVLELLPEDDSETDVRASALSTLGQSYLAQHRLGAALEAFERFLQLRPDHAGTHVSIGYIHDRRNDREQALRAFKKALHVDPDNLDAHYNIAVVLLAPAERAERDTREAIGHLRWILENAPQHARRQRDVGEMLLAIERFEDGLAAIERALELRPGLPVDHKQVGWAYVTIDKPDQAIDHFRRYLERHPQAPDADDIRAAIDHLTEG